MCFDVEFAVRVAAAGGPAQTGSMMTDYVGSLRLTQRVRTRDGCCVDGQTAAADKGELVGRRQKGMRRGSFHLPSDYTD